MPFPQNDQQREIRPYEVEEYQIRNSQPYQPTTSGDSSFQRNYNQEHSDRYEEQDEYVLQDLDSSRHQYAEMENVAIPMESMESVERVEEEPTSSAPPPPEPPRRQPPSPPQQKQQPQQQKQQQQQQQQQHLIPITERIENQNGEPSSSILPQTTKFGQVAHRTTNMVLIDTKQFLENFWVMQKRKIEAMPEQEVIEKCKHMPIPQARVKKIMRIDEDVRGMMISADAPLFLAEAAELFIEEATSLAWHVVDESRRRTMQKSDVIIGLQRSEQFDFLIDLIPRDITAKRTTTWVEANILPAGYSQGQQSTNRNQSETNAQPPNQDNLRFRLEEIPTRNLNCNFETTGGNTVIMLDEHGNIVRNLSSIQCMSKQNEDGRNNYQAVQGERQIITFRNAGGAANQNHQSNQQSSTSSPQKKRFDNGP